MEKVLNKIKRNIFSRLLFDNCQDLQGTVLLAGSARSGTTWLGDVINFNNGYRYMFEPFHPRHGIPFGDIDGRRYIRSGSSESNDIAIARSILSGRVRSEWVDKFNKKMVCNKRLVKDVYANLILKWLQDNFPEIKIIFIIRHPYAVASSRQKLPDWNFFHNPDQFLSQDDLMEDFLHPFESQISSVQSDFAKEVLSWCIDNYVPLKQFKRGDIHLALYEDFRMTPEREIDRMLDFIGEKSRKEAYSNLSRPSLTSRGGGIAAVNESWKNRITSSHEEEARSIIKTFGLDQIYPDDSAPCIDAAYSIMREM
jgi:hypothetical protein